MTNTVADIEEAMSFGAEGLTQELCDALEKARGCNIEIIMKDTHTVQHQRDRFARWTHIAREEIAARLEMSVGAVKVAVHRLRQRYRKLLRATIAETVSNEADLEDEMRYLVTVLRKQ